MNGNVACSVPDCTNNVIGQCQGYKEPCGHFFCSKHSVGRLCDECAAVKETERLYYEYDGYARYVRKTGKAVGIFFGFMFLFGMIGELVAMLLGASRTTFTIIMGLGMVIGIIIGLSTIKKGRNKRYEEICSKTQGFPEYYTLWREEKKKEALRSAGGIAIASIVGAVAGALSYEGQIARDVDRIRRRVDRL